MEAYGMYGGGMGYGGFGGQGYNGGLPFVEEGDTHHQHAKRQRTETGAAAASGNDREGQDPERTVFVGGIGPDASEDELRSLFSHYGSITSIKVIYDRTVQPPRCKGFGFVTFDDAATAEQLRTVGKLDFKGRSVDIGKAGGKTAGPQPGAVQVTAPSAGAERKVFVGNIPKEADETTLQWFFQEYGAVEEVKLVTDQGTGNRKGYGFVTFTDKQSADAVKKMRQADFMGRTMNFGDAVAGGIKGKPGGPGVPGAMAPLGRGGPAGTPGGHPMGYPGAVGPWAGAPGGGMIPPGFAGMGGPNAMAGHGGLDPTSGQFVQSAFGAFAFGPALTAHSAAGQYDPFGGMGMGLGAGPLGVPRAAVALPAVAQAKANTISFIAASGGLPAKTQLSVPEACVFRLAGPQGSNLNAMMVQSGAVLMLHPANPKSPDRILEITGTTPQVQLAQQMVSAIVLSLSPTAPPERDPACKVFVGGLAATTDVPQIVVAMFRFGTVAHAKIPVDPATGRQRGFGFVVFADANAALLAKAERTVQVEGRNVEIKDAMKGVGKQQGQQGQ